MDSSDDEEAETSSPVASNQLHQVVTPNSKTVLPSPFASLVSLVASTSSLGLSIGSFVSSLAITGAKVTTLTSFEVARAVLEGILSRAGQDVVHTSTGAIGKAAAESILEKTLSALHYTITRTSFLVSAGFQIGSTSVSSGLAIGQYFVGALDAVLGDTETSKAIATIIVLVQRELGNQQPGSNGKRVGMADVITGVTGFALLQRWGQEQTQRELRDSGAVESIWDIVVLAESNEHVITPVTPDNDDDTNDSDEAIRPRSRRSQRSASFVSALGDRNHFAGTANEDYRSFRSANSRPASSHILDQRPEEAFRESLVHQLRPGDSVKVTARSMTIDTVTVELRGDSNAVLQPPQGYNLIAAENFGRGCRRLVFQTHRRRRKSGEFDIANDFAQVQESPLHSDLPSSFPFEGSSEGVLLPPFDDEESVDVEGMPPDEPTRANQKRPRSPFVALQGAHCPYPIHPMPTSSDNRFNLQSPGPAQEARPSPKKEKKSSVKESLKRGSSYKHLVEFWNSNNMRKKSPGGERMKRAPQQTQYQSNVPLDRPGPLSPIHPSRMASNPSSTHNPFHSCNSPMSTPQPWSAPQRPRRPPMHRKGTSSMHSVTTTTSESSLVLHSGDGNATGKSVSVSLGRNGRMSSQFPILSFAGNAVRYSRFSTASYGSNFLKIIGAATHTSIPDVSSSDPLEHQSFSSYARLPRSTVLLSSFVDPQGVPVAAGKTNTATVLVHYVSLDHKAKAVVLACRGTLGFEDILTDLTADYEDIEWSGRTYQAHQGILAAARKLIESNDGQLIATVRAALEEFSDYGLVLCGHSLGGGVATILAMLLSQSNQGRVFGNSAFITKLQSEGHVIRDRPRTGASVEPKFTLPPGRPIHAYAYGPAASVTPELQEATKGLVTTFVYGQDHVPYLSLGTLRDFQSIAYAFKTDNQNAKGEVRRRVWGGLEKAFRNKAGFDAPNGLFGSQWYHEEDDDQWPWEALKSLRAGLSADKLVPAGEIFHVESRPVLQRHAFVSKDKKEDDIGSFKPATHVTLTHVRDVGKMFGEIKFGASMFADHIPTRCELALEILEKGLGG